jgi:hypothetical protein
MRPARRLTLATGGSLVEIDAKKQPNAHRRSTVKAPEGDGAPAERTEQARQAETAGPKLTGQHADRAPRRANRRPETDRPAGRNSPKPSTDPKEAPPPQT